MTKLAVSPEGLELANEYLVCGSIEAAAKSLSITTDKAVQLLSKGEVRRYLDAVYLDMGYRNRDKLGKLMDEIIESKLEEARDTEIYTSKDLLDVIQLVHKMRMDEIKSQQAGGDNIKNQTNVQINENGVYGQGNYGKLMEKLMKGDSTVKEVEV